MSHTMSTWKLPSAMPSKTSGIASKPAASVAWRRSIALDVVVALSSTDSEVHPTSIRLQIGAQECQPGRAIQAIP